ncbi:MAG: chloride channel protein [Microthrixaceae bacterium]
MSHSSPSTRNSKWALLPGFGSMRLRAGLAIPVAVVGIGSGLIGAAYLAVLRFVTHWIGPKHHPVMTQAVIMVSVGLAVTLITKWLGDSGNVELLVDNIHVLGGAEDLRQVRPLIPTSLLCVGAGGAMGPEAPLVQASGSFGTWVAEWFDLDAHDMRTLTITGMAAGFSVLFGAPIGAALFALEILHKRGLQYYEALVPSLVGALIGYALNFAVTGLGLVPVWKLPDVGKVAGTDLLWGVGCGVLGAIGALAFTAAVQVSHRLIARVPPSALPVGGGVLLALLFWWSPFALTNGELQVEAIAVGTMTAGALAVVIAAKFVAVIVTISGRWKGGFIIPLFFIGIVAGELIHRLIPTTNTTVLMVSLAVALCVGVTKTPLGSTLVVTEMAGLALLPMALTAAVIALVFTSHATVIETQRARTPVPHGER